MSDNWSIRTHVKPGTPTFERVLQVTKHDRPAVAGMINVEVGVVTVDGLPARAVVLAVEAGMANPDIVRIEVVREE